MEALFLRVGWISLTCSAVLIPLLVGKGWLRQHVRARALYVVWLILALRLVIPVDLSLPEPAVTVEAPSYQVSLPARAPSANLPTALPTEESAAEAGQTAPAAASAVRTIPVTALLSALWLFGALAAALVQGGGYLLARRRLLRDARPDLEAEEQAGQTAAGLGLKRAVPVRRSGQVRTPMVLGLIRPVLLLPEGQAVDEVVLCHELTHLKRLDLAYKALLVAACWLHWFNPLVWWMSRVAGQNLELCCDDDVAAGRDAAFRRKYGELLLSTAEEKPGPTLSSRFGGSKQAMKDRLTNLFVKKKRGRLLACTAVAVLVLVGGLVAWFVSGRSKDEGLNKARFDRGTLIASGFIAGGALMGVVSAVLKFVGVDWFLSGWASSNAAEWTGLAMYLVLIGYFAWHTLRAKKEE